MALVAASAILAAGCGDDGGSTTSPGDKVSVDLLGEVVETGYPEGAEPVRGGQLVYGLEAETDNLCLSSAQVAISGMQLIRAIYDPLVAPDAEGRYKPYLADSLEPSEDYRTWTIKLRPGVVFHDGTPLDATVVKNNLDAYRGQYPNRVSTLFSFVFENIDTVSVVNEFTVKVTTKVPWVAFDAALYNSGRIGIMAQAQLDADPSDCERNPIGTGPFEFVSWTKGESLTVARNADYWQVADDGEPYPYLNAIEFRPMANSDERLSALVQGDLNMMHTSVVSDLTENVPNLREEGVINSLVSDDFTETAYIMFNTAEAPFDNRDARIAVAHAIDRQKLNDLANNGGAQLADGPFAPNVMGYVDDAGRPAHDPAKAKEMVAALQAQGVSTKIVFLATIDPSVIRSTTLIIDMLREAGFEVELETESQEVLINRALEGDYHAATFRNQPGDDPDMNYVWWYGKGNPVNFAKFDDPVINEALEKGRSEPDPEKRRGYYETIHRQMASEVYYAYNWYVPWAVLEADTVHGILGPPLPSGGAPSTGLATGHALHGVWIEH